MPDVWKVMLTIGIPTYNRSNLLREALGSVLRQTSDEVRIVVLDNASSDDTAKVVREHGSRVKYERNETNIGPLANFNRLVDYCETEFFSWLQDDDCLHHAFAERALAGLRSDSSVKVYSAYALMSRGMHSHYKPNVYGPPFPVDFLGPGGVKTYDGKLLAPFSLIMSVTFPPISAFRVDDLRAYLKNPTGLTMLFGERSWALHAAAAGCIAVDPFIGAIVRAHPGQGQFELLHCEIEEWNILAKDVDNLVATWDSEWCATFADALAQTEVASRLVWLKMAEKWPDNLAVCRLVAKALRDSLAERSVPREGKLGKTLLRDLTPPLLWKALGWGKKKWQILHDRS